MFLYIICSTFDMVILYIYFNQILGPRRENIPFALYIFSFVLNEVALLGLMYFTNGINNTYNLYINVAVSFLLTFALTFLHERNIKHQLMVSVSFQAYAVLSEIAVLMIFSFLPKDMCDSLMNNDAYGAIISKIVLFILLNITMLFFEKRKAFQSVKYSALVLIMPILSIVVMLTIPIQNSPEHVQTVLSLIGMTGILAANITNYFLLQNILSLNEMRRLNATLDKQIEFQVAKYEQISSAYRDTRRLIHDTKKHYFVISEYVNQKNYDSITEYLNTSINELEKSYIRVNTGNLVIDSFINNCSLIAKDENIQFRTNIQVVKNKIKMKDYDLSTIVGNLLDNAINSCRKIIPPNPKQIAIDIITTDKELLIHICNTTSHCLALKNSEDNSLNHGYGMQNIERVTLAYCGTYTHKIDEDGVYHAIVSVPFIEKNGVVHRIR